MRRIMSCFFASLDSPSVRVRPRAGVGVIEARWPLADALQHDNEQHHWHNTHVIATEPHMNAIHSRDYLQESAGCRYRQGFQIAAFPRLGRFI